MSEVYNLCLRTINCTGKNISSDLSMALGVANASMYVCSKDLRPSEKRFYFLSFGSVVLSIL